MTCKDCFHFEVCDSGRRIGEYEVDDGIYTDGVENECLTFKNKADFAEVKHGEWLDNIENGCTVAGVQGGFLVGYRCSLCGKFEMRKEPYCNCGAKMDGERRDT